MIVRFWSTDHHFFKGLRLLLFLVVNLDGVQVNLRVENEFGYLGIVRYEEGAVAVLHMVAITIKFIEHWSLELED